MPSITITYRTSYMKLKNEYILPSHLRNEGGLPRSQDERLLWIKQRVEAGYYESDKIRQAVAEAFLEPPVMRRAGDQAIPGGKKGIIFCSLRS